jgi:hypothetical protein
MMTEQHGQTDSQEQQPHEQADQVSPSSFLDVGRSHLPDPERDDGEDRVVETEGTGKGQGIG